MDGRGEGGKDRAVGADRKGGTKDWAADAKDLGEETKGCGGCT